MGSVKRWYAAVAGTPLPCPVPPVNYHHVVLASDYDAKERECDVERRRAEKAEAMTLDWIKRFGDVEADRDKLAAKVERVRAVVRDKQNIWYPPIIDRLRAALADEETPTGTCELCAPPDTWTAHISGTHGYGKCVERRKGERRRGCMCISCNMPPIRRSGRDRRGAR